ncbi:hypothetical protein HD554DRAFT_2037944 [Boletus coccyginus]|nr:hypothetical protein HD554DRAFT_2037944 [Boletus coccyginus]
MYKYVEKSGKIGVLYDAEAHPKLNILETLVELLDVIVWQLGGNFRQAMNGLNYLLQCKDTWQILIEKLRANPPNSDMFRLSRILEVDGMDYTQDWNYHEFPQVTWNACVRANLTSALVCLNSNTHDSVDGQGHNIDPGQRILHNLFELDGTEFSEPHRELIRELKKAVRREVPSYARLRCKDSALLAAYTLATCLKYSDMKEFIKDNELLPKHIIGMLQLDYFDDTVGLVKGFQIFGDFMQHANLREKIKNYNITKILNTKLEKGKLREIHTSLVCLDNFWSFDACMEGSESRGDDSLYISPDRFASAAILRGFSGSIAGISPQVYKIIKMLLLEGYLSIQPQADPMGPTSTNEVQTTFMDDGTCMCTAYFGAEQQVLPGILRRLWN